MGKQVFLFWPGDGRKAPNDLAQASMESATHQLELALRKLGREPRLLKGFISKPHEADRKTRSDHGSDDRSMRALVLRASHNGRSGRKA